MLRVWDTVEGMMLQVGSVWEKIGVRKKKVNLKGMSVVLEDLLTDREK